VSDPIYTTASEFVQEWNALIKSGKPIDNIAIFTHGSKGALEFLNSTLPASEIATLPKLNYTDAAQTTVELHSCNSGLGTPSAAKAFAQSQNVRATGMDGYSDFSESKSSFVRNEGSGNLYLNAYDRGRNTTSNAGRALEKVLGTPIGGNGDSRAPIVTPAGGGGGASGAWGRGADGAW
jgi:hypothetical protein